MADPADCARVLGAARRLRGFIDAVEAGVARRMMQLHAEQEAAPAADVHPRRGVSAAEGKRKERRSRTLDEAPSFEDALGSVRSAPNTSTRWRARPRSWMTM
ncbi:MAG: hypothetical protein R2697_03635 [Ilumatobacteraceae bacterium]